MKELIKKIASIVGGEVIVIGDERYEGIKTIKPEEMDLFPRKYEHVIIEDASKIDEEKMNRAISMAEKSVWILLSLDKFMEEIEEFGKKMAFGDLGKVSVGKNLRMLEELKDKFLAMKLSSDKIALVYPKKEMKVEAEPFSNFFLTLSMVEYLKSKFLEADAQRKMLEIELKTEREKVERMKEDVKRLGEEIEHLKKALEEKDEEIRRREKEKRELLEEFEKEKRKLIEIHKKELEKERREKEKLERETEKLKNSFEREKGKLKNIFEKEKRNLIKKYAKELEKVRKEKENLKISFEEERKHLLDNFRKELEKEKEERDKILKRFEEELKTIITEMGLKLQAKEEKIRVLEEEIERLREKE